MSSQDCFDFNIVELTVMNGMHENQWIIAEAPGDCHQFAKEFDCIV